MNHQFEFEPIINPTEATANSDELMVTGESCVNGVHQFLSNPERVAAATTSLFETAPKPSSPLEIYQADKSQPEYTYIGRL